MAESKLTVVVTSPERVLFEGLAQSVSCPGEQGVFEVLALHRPFISRLVAGTLTIDGRGLPIRRGVVRVADDVVTAIVEIPS
jgi:F-type H+-transporting ATPase subunit epsilon